jgi:hypothetical protein
MAMKRPFDQDLPPRGRVAIGLVASPGPASELAAAVRPELERDLDERFPGIEWSVQLVSSRLVEPPADLSELIGAARRRLLNEGWQLALCVTDLPLQTARRPVVAHASATHGVAVLSLPALGPMALRRRATHTLVRLVRALVTDEAGAGIERRAYELSQRVVDDENGLRFVARVMSGNLRLLLGMLRANRPWRLAASLSHVLVAALAASAFALVNTDLWRLADHLGGARLTLFAVGSALATAAALVFGANLWERASKPAAREQVVLFNVVTLLTVIIGVLVLYAALLAATSIGAFLLPRGLFATALEHRAYGSDHFELAWLSASLATVGGALGAALESDTAVREAAYTYHPDESVK